MTVDIQQENTTKSERSSIRRFSRAVVILILLLVLSVVAFYGFENNRGRRAWARYCASAGPLGLPNRTPEMDARIQASITAAKELEALSGSFDKVYPQYISSLAFAPSGQFEDLVAWGRLALIEKSGQTNQQPEMAGSFGDGAARAAAAAVVLESLQGQEPFLEKLRAACRGPNPVNPFGYDRPPSASWFPPVPYIFQAINVCRYLKVRMTAELALGRTSEALDDLQLMLDLSNSLGPDEMLISGIGSIACRKLALSPVWAGLADRRFTDAELQRLQQLIGSSDLLIACHRNCLAERNQMLAFMDWSQRTGRFNEFGDPLVGSVFPYAPAGWVQLEKVGYAKGIDKILTAAFSDGSNLIHLRACAKVYEQLLSDLQSTSGVRLIMRHTAMAKSVTPRLAEFIANCTSAQVMTDQVLLACGLERYYLKHSRYPDNLDQLVREFISQLPVDPLSGEVCRYALDENGRYKLWSLGPDEVDNGGVQGESPYSFNNGAGDWVWCYPE